MPFQEHWGSLALVLSEFQVEGNKASSSPTVEFVNEHKNALNGSCSVYRLLMGLTAQLKSSLNNRSVISGSLQVLNFFGFQSKQIHLNKDHPVSAILKIIAHRLK